MAACSRRHEAAGRPRRTDFPDRLVFIQDTRERQPYDLPGAVRGTLNTGDYAIEGLDTEAAVERKTRGDAYRSVGAERARFQREFERMSRMRFAAVVIETTVDQFLDPPAFTKMSGKSALRTLLGWSVKYGVPIYFAGSREYGESITRSLLEFYWRHRREEVSRSA